MHTQDITRFSQLYETIILLCRLYNGIRNQGGHALSDGVCDVRDALLQRLVNGRSNSCG